MLKYIVRLLNEIKDTKQYKGVKLIRIIEEDAGIAYYLEYNSWLDRFEIPISAFEYGRTVSEEILRTELRIKDALFYYYVDENRKFCFGIR